MKELGIISHLSNRGRLILRTKKTPAFGLTVLNQEGKRLGIVHDVFGPSKEPYVSVKIFANKSKNIANRVGEKLYVAPRNKPKGGRRRRKKK